MTLSHPAAVLPLRRLGLLMTALVVGSMIPDVPLFLGLGKGYALTHSLMGAATVDVLAGLIVVAVWFWAVRDALVDVAPNSIRNRLEAHALVTTRQWLLAPVAVFIGALTHIVWDAFTHPDRWGVRQVPWLAQDHAQLPGHKWAQYLSGVLGLAVVLLAIVRHLRSLPDLQPNRPRRLPVGVFAVVVVVATTTGLATALIRLQQGFHSMAYNAVVNTIIVMVLGIIATCIAWHLARMPDRDSASHHV